MDIGLDFGIFRFVRYFPFRCDSWCVLMLVGFWPHGKYSCVIGGIVGRSLGLRGDVERGPRYRRSSRADTVLTRDRGIRGRAILDGSDTRTYR